VCLTTAVTRPTEGQQATLGAPLHASHSADTEVFYMAGKQLAALGRTLAQQAWAGDTPVSVVSNAGLPTQLHSDHTVASLAEAALLHAGRPTVVVVGEGARALPGVAAQTSQTEKPQPVPGPLKKTLQHSPRRMPVKTPIL
jgi:uroporphyrin-III C-methyltransferase